MISYIRKIKCPRHYLLKPGGVPFVMERIPSLKNISEADGKAFKIKLWRPKKDKFGNKIQNFKDYVQSEILASEAKLRVFNPLHPICDKCRRCVTA